ncbi:hypothetical protein V6N11_031251 [Hibiscus sabdariffa]|uniref:Uncharacterized protein n=1 Tax=Hibiscus sabdariffa TaxID=183260 RepID=A0ABR2SX18_9ROSI
MARMALCFVRVGPLKLAACFVVCLPFDDALAGAVGASRSCGSCTHPSGHVSHSRMPWPHCPCATTGLLVSLRGAALDVGLIFFLPITDWKLGAVPVVAAHGYLSCFPSFHLTWCASMVVLWFLCLRPIVVLVADLVCGIDLGARPFQWPLFGMEFAASHAAWLIEQSLNVALATAEGAPLVCCFRLWHSWRVSPLYAVCFLCLHPASRLLDGSECGIVLAARPHWWQCFGVAFAACFTAWLPLQRLGFPARPHDRLPTCFTSYLLWAKFSNYCFGLCRLSTSSRIALHPPYLIPPWRRLLHYLPTFFRERLATRPRGRLSVVDDDLDVPVSVDSAAASAAEGPSVRPGSNGTNASVSASEPIVPIVATPAVRTPPPAATSLADTPPDLSVPSGKADLMEEALDEASPDQDASDLAADKSIPDDAPYDPMVHNETSDMLEEALEISRDCVLLADLTGVIQADGEDLVNEAIPEAADSIIREVAASILGVPAPSDVPVVPSRQAPSLSASPSKPGLSKSASAGLRRAAMPVVPEHHEFDEWCAARSRTPLATAQNQPAGARASSIPPPRPHKRQASSSDPSRAKRSRLSTSSTTRIPLMPKAGMSSVNNSPAETARQSHREK